MLRLFGPFCRDFFVPWESIAITRETSVFSPGVKLHFGNPVIGTLRIRPDDAERLAFAASGRWPKTGHKTEPSPEEGRRDFLRKLLTQWAIFTGAAALFFVFEPLLGFGGGRPSLVVGILFPAIFFGVITFARYLAERR